MMREKFISLSIAKKTIIILLCFFLLLFLLLAGTVFGLRAYNDHKYGNAKPLTSIDVKDISQYPTELDEIEVKYVDSGSFQGFHLVPNHKLYSGVIVCYGGSDGGPFFEMAQQYAEKGYETLAVFMFGMKNQQKKLVKVPLEQFEDVLLYVNNNIEDHDPITVMGASKGAEYVLNLAAKYDEISNVVLLAPVAYSFSGLGSGDTSSSSSWTWKDKELPYVDLNKAPFSVIFKSMLFPMITRAPVEFRNMYDGALKADKQRDEKRIPVQDIKADILMIVGEDDGMMDTLQMAELIQSQKKDAKICSYKNAGHMFSGDGVVVFLNMRTRLGGDSQGNEKAAIECRKEMENFLKTHHDKIR